MQLVVAKENIKRKSKIGIIPVGYYEGYDRLLSNKAKVLIKGQYASVIGRISMHITIIDVTDIENVNVGDEVVLIGKQGENNITVEELAEVYYRSLVIAGGKEPKAFTPEELQKWEYPSEINLIK